MAQQLANGLASSGQARRAADWRGRRREVTELKGPQQQEMEGTLQGRPPLMLLAQALGPCWNRCTFASLKISNLKVRCRGLTVLLTQLSVKSLFRNDRKS